METPRWWDYLRRSNVTPKEVINLPPVSSYDQAICACLFYCVVIWEKTYCTSCVLFVCRSIQMRSAHAWNVNAVISVIEPTCWRSSVSLYLSVNKYTDCFSVYLTVTYYLFILTTHKSLYTYVIFLHNLFYNIVLWYTLLYNKLFIPLMWFVCIINCYYVIIFFVEENPNKVMLRVIIYLYVSFLFPCRWS